MVLRESRKICTFYLIILKMIAASTCECHRNVHHVLTVFYQVPTHTDRKELMSYYTGNLISTWLIMGKASVLDTT